MASLDKEGLYYVKEDPQLGKIRGLDPWAVENGIHLIRMEQDAAEGIMMIRKSNQQQYGTVHGGVLVAFADTIAGHSLAPHGRMCVTQGSTVNFLRPAAGAYLFCRATPLQVGSRICVVSVEQRNDRDELITTALFTFAVVKRMDPILLPPKHPGLSLTAGPLSSLEGGETAPIEKPERTVPLRSAATGGCRSDIPFLEFIVALAALTGTGAAEQFFLCLNLGPQTGHPVGDTLHVGHDQAGNGGHRQDQRGDFQDKVSEFHTKNLQDTVAQLP